MAVGKGFLDQYSVFCVFGSVVGCVVVPLITQSIESVIFSAIVISLTATHLSKRAVNGDTSNKVHTQQNKDLSLKKSKEATGLKKKSPKKSAIPVRSSNFRQRKEQKIKQIEETRKIEEQRKQDEKRDRKAKKKEVKVKQKEEEKEEEERRRKVKDEKIEKSTSPIIERRKSKSKPQVNTTMQKGIWITPSNTRSPTNRKSPAGALLPIVINDSLVTPLNGMLPCDALYREKCSSSPDSTTDAGLCPPPSVWKVPEYVPPQWNPSKLGEGSVKENIARCCCSPERLNNDVILEQRKRPTPVNQLRNPVIPNTVKCKNQYMNQDVSKINITRKDSDPNLLVDVPSKFVGKPDNRLTHQSTSPYSNITGLPSFFKSSTTETNGGDLPQQKTYSLFGPEEPNRVLFRPIFQGNVHAS